MGSEIHSASIQWIPKAIYLVVKHPEREFGYPTPSNAEVKNGGHTTIHPKFPGLVLPSGQKLALGLLATITLEVVPFRSYVPFPALLSFLNASWKKCSVRVFSTACDSASIISVVSKWRPFSFVFNRGNREK
jgi:hypothetical protein